MRAGDLRWTVAVQRLPLDDANLTSTGQPDPDGWEQVFTRRVHVEEIPGTSQNDGTAQRQQTRWFHVTMRLTGSLTKAHRFVITGAPYDDMIFSITNVRHDLRWTYATCCVRGNRRG